jgi:hypothetical protein
LLGEARGPGKLYLGDVECVKTRDVGVVGGGYGLLRLNDFDIVRNAGDKTIPCLS